MGQITNPAFSEIKIALLIMGTLLMLLLTGGLQICQAGGIYITQIATPGSVGTAGVSNVVNNIDASSVFTNPAGMQEQ